MSDADWMREAEEAMALRGVAAEAMRERDRLQAEVARLRGMVAEYDAELVKLRAEDAEWSELCNQQQQIIEEKFFIKDPQVCGWCWMAAGDSEESKESLQRFTIADIRKHTLTCANNPLVAERDAARAEVERLTLTAEDREALRWARRDLVSMHTPYQTSDHEQYLAALAVLDRLLSASKDTP